MNSDIRKRAEEQMKTKAYEYIGKTDIYPGTDDYVKLFLAGAEAQKGMDAREIEELKEIIKSIRAQAYVNGNDPQSSVQITKEKDQKYWRGYQEANQHIIREIDLEISSILAQKEKQDEKPS